MSGRTQVKEANRSFIRQCVCELKKFAESRGVTGAKLACVLHQLNADDLAYLERTSHEGAIAGDRYPVS